MCPVSLNQHFIPRKPLPAPGKKYLAHHFKNHFKDFCDTYEEQYAKKNGRFHLDHIMGVADHFIDCGDYLKGLARIRCTNPDCGHDYFRPFSCKSFYLCPSCSQKRTILMAEHLTEEVFLRLTHRQFVTTGPKALRIYFRNNRNLFADVSRLIFRILKEFYKEAAGRTIQTGMVIAHQTFGDKLRWNPHFHCIVLDGGFDEDMDFIYIFFSDVKKMTEYFRRKVIALFLKNKLINEDFARNLLAWLNSGFYIDYSVQILTDKTRVNLSEYISRAPVSLKKHHYEPFKGRVLFHTHYNKYFGENIHIFEGMDYMRPVPEGNGLSIQKL